jgi:hypothetical protein
LLYSESLTKSAKKVEREGTSSRLRSYTVEKLEKSPKQTQEIGLHSRSLSAFVSVGSSFVRWAVFFGFCAAFLGIFFVRGRTKRAWF